MAERGTTPRGFTVYAEFTDTYGSEIRVQQSSSAEGPRVWVFAGHAVGHVPERRMIRLMQAGFSAEELLELAAQLTPSPHLDVEQARRTVAALNEFIAEHGVREDEGRD